MGWLREWLFELGQDPLATVFYSVVLAWFVGVGAWLVWFAGAAVWVHWFG